MTAKEITRIPLIDYALIAEGKKDKFLAQLRHAFVVVGFCYLKNAPIDKNLTERLMRGIPKLFDLPQEQKDACAMVNTSHFLGYTRLGTEITKGAIDIREQYDFATPYTCPWKEGDPDYLKLWGGAQYPEALPELKETIIDYLDQTGRFGFEFMSLLAESFFLPPDTFDKFYETPRESMQHRGKVVKYPVLDSAKGNQGVGPHYDSGFLTLLLQASEQPGLQVQSPSGAWIDATPIPGTLVVNLGKGLETVTRGVARATCHRVLSPDPKYGPRYSVPYFQMIAQNIYLNEMQVFDSDKPLHPEIQQLVAERGSTGAVDAVNYSEYSREPSGLVALIGRIKSHPDVGERHYPERYSQIFKSST